MDEIRVGEMTSSLESNKDGLFEMKMLIGDKVEIPLSALRRHMAAMSGAEFKLYMYIVSRTLGCRRLSARISISQFQYGIVPENGPRYDFGAGLSAPTIISGLKSLEKSGYIGSNTPKNTVAYGRAYWIKPTRLLRKTKLDEQTGVIREKMHTIRSRKGRPSSGT